MADVLPEEPGGDAGYNALFGHKFVAPVVSPDGPLVDLDGNPITDGNGNLGFPGFGPVTASQSLAYISDAHDDPATERASGPGQADYVARLATYNEAWGKFFARLTADGITKDNTLFVITADGVEHHGIDATWSDHTDIRPTMLALAGLTDGYAHDGRVLVENLREEALPPSLRGESGRTFELLAAAYKQINAPVGRLAMDTLEASTAALSGDDATYAAVETQLGALTTRRDVLAATIIQKLEAAEFEGTPLDFATGLDLAAKAEELLFEARLLRH